MGSIMDFKCEISGDTGLSAEKIRELNLVFPDVHRRKDAIIAMSRALKEKDGSKFCEMPFCSTVEAESMGGKVNYGNEVNGPRGAEYIASSIEDILDVPEIDYTKGRIHEVLRAAEELSRQGETVLMHVSGPLTILNVLIDSKYVFKAMRKTPEVVFKIFKKIETELLKFLEEVGKRGVKMVSYADPAGGVQLLGPKVTAQYVDEFVHPFLKKAEEKFPKDLLIVLCPKTTFALLGTGKAEFKEIDLGGAISYGDALVSLIGKEIFAGQICIKDKGQVFKNGKINALRLL